MRDLYEMGETRKFNQTNEFGQIYEIMCSQKGVSPLSTIQSRLTVNRLRFCCDRVNHEDWSPILNALAGDRSLVEIHAYSRCRKRKIAETIDSEEKLDEYRRCGKTSSRGPIIYTNFLLRCFVDALAVCSRDSKLLTSLTIDGIPLGCEKYLDTLCTGFSLNRNLRNISLARCRIGDSGCELVLRAFLDNPNLRLIDLTSCSLTSKSAHFITSFLKKRRIKLLENVWHESASRKDTNSEQFQGLRTLILNKNRKFGDEGLRTLSDTLKDDFWLKSLSLRRCGLTRKSGDSIFDLLETNSILVSMNLKDNKLPVKILKTTKRLLKRRLEKGERISPRRRLVNRKKDLRSKRTNRQLGKTAKNRQIKSNRMIVASNSRKKDNLVVINDKRSDLTELNERLSNLIDRNGKLKRGLSNEKRLLVGEKRSRIDAEKSYRLMSPVIEKLRHGYEKQNRINSRVLFESHLCTDIRKIFRDLENISATNARNFDSKGYEEKIETREAIVEKFSIDEFEEKRRKFGSVQKRPHCPPRQRV